MNVSRLTPRVLVRADDDVPAGFEGAELAGLDGVVLELRFQNPARQKELVAELLVLLFGHGLGVVFRQGYRDRRTWSGCVTHRRAQLRGEHGD